MKSPANPYVGPRAFLENELLYGRDREVADLRDMLLAERIVLLYSPSGAGKSSLLQARLIPVMRERGFTVRKVIRVNAAPPPASTGNRYVISMMTSLQLEGRPADFEKLTLNQYLDAEPNGELLVFDQFEEVLTTDAVNIQAKRDFFEQIGHALRARGRWALFAMREDFLAALDPYLNYIPTRLSNTFRLGLLSYEASLKAIREPAARVGVKFLDDAVQQIADDLRQVNVPQPDGSVSVQLGQVIEPVQLQVVCLRRWEDLAEGSQEITKSAQAQIGSTALADYYAATVAQVASDSGTTERTIRDWFEHSLITKVHTRGQVMMHPNETDGLDNDAVIKPLEQAHLVNSDLRLGSRWLELSHDRLIQPVRSNNEAWNQKNLNPLQREAELWNDQGRPPDLLFGTESLPAAEEWAQANKLNSTEEDFLKESRAAVQQRVVEEERRLKDVRTALILKRLIAALLLVVAFAIYKTAKAHYANIIAEKATEVAESGKLLGEALIYRGTHQDLAALLGIEGMNKAQESSKDTFQARQTLLKLLQANPFLRAVLHHGHGDVYSVTFSQDGKLLASGSANGTVQLWDLDSRQALGDPLPTGGNVVAFSPDGQLLASASDTGIQLWELTTRQKKGAPFRVNSHYFVASLSFLQQGKTLASVSEDGIVQLWDVLSGNTNGKPSPALGTVMAFSPDGELLATASDQGSPQLWDVAKGQKKGGPLREKSDEVNNTWISSLAFSPDGERLAVASANGTVQLWDVQSGQPWGLPLLCHSKSVQIVSMAFHGDGKHLAVSSDDGFLQLWDVANSDQYRLMVEPMRVYSNAIAFRPLGIYPDSIHLLASAGNYGMVQLLDPEYGAQIGKLLPNPKDLSKPVPNSSTGVALSADGKLLAFSSIPAHMAGTLQLWDLDHERPVGKPLKVSGVPIVFSRNGRRFLLANNADRTVQIWDVDGRRAVSEPLKIRSFEVALSPDGKRLAVADSHDGTIQLWDADSGTKLGDALPQPGNLPDKKQPVSIATLVFSPDGTHLAAAGDDGVIHVWDVSSRSLASKPLKASGVQRMMFSPDANRLAAASEDGTIRLWNDVYSPKLHGETLQGHEPVGRLAFSPDGNLLALGSAWGSIQLFDTNTYSPLGEPLKGHQGEITGLAFPNDTTLISASDDGRVWQWDIDPESWARKLCSIANRNLSQDEWNKYMKDKPYQPTCRDLPSGEGAPAN